MKRNKKIILAFSIVLAIVLLSAVVLTACLQKADTITSAEQLNDKKYTIAVSTGASAASVIPKTFPNAEIAYTTTDSDAFALVKSGKADAYAHDLITLEYAIASGGVKDLTILEQTYDSVDIAVGINKRYSEQLLDSVNAFLQQLKEDGTLEDMRRRWVTLGDETMPAIPDPESPDPNNVITIGTAGVVTPMTYFVGDQITGFEVELIKRYAHYANVMVKIDVMGFDAIVAGLQSERLHMAFSNLNATEDRKQVIDFSDAYLVSEVALAVKSDRIADNGIIQSLDQLNGKTIAHITGASYQPKLKELFPDSELVALDTTADMIQALKSNRVSAYFVDDPMARSHLNETKGLKIVGEPIIDDKYAYIVSDEKQSLIAQINALLAKYEENGTMKRLEEKWIDGEGDPNLKFDENTPCPNGSLNIGACIDAVPFTYQSRDNIVGYEVELMYLICAELGYKPVITKYEFDALLVSIKTTEDIIMGCITWTAERAQTMNFTDKIYTGGPVAVVLSGEEVNVGFFQSIKDSFYSTFVKEQRWKLIANGLLVTIELSLMSILFGTLIGFAYSFALRSKNKAVCKIAEAVSVIIDGLPLVVILMVLYYVIFAKTNLPAILIGAIGFIMGFSNNVAHMLNTGIMAVDKGQIEAGESMGYSKLQVFGKITFPQAANQMFGQYSGSVISLIKETSIIGYITVEDLTRASDIIRSRTYEAFFPLIVTAIIYFVIARLFVFLLSLLARKLDPKQRKREVKGVTINDQN